MKSFITQLEIRQQIILMIDALLFSFSAVAQKSRIITDPSGATASIILPDLQLILIPNDAICYGDNNVGIVATRTGGTAPYKITLDGSTWIENVTSPYTFTTLSSGN